MSKKVIIFLLTVVFIMTSWSPIEDSTTKKFDKVQLRTIVVSGMTYVVAYGQNDNVGVALNNVTLDSLKCIYYKNKINE